MGLAVEVAQGRPTLHAHVPRSGIDDDRTHVGEVDNQAVVAERATGNVVAAAADGNEYVVGSGEADGLHHITGASAALCSER